MKRFIIFLSVLVVSRLFKKTQTIKLTVLAIAVIELWIFGHNIHPVTNKDFFKNKPALADTLYNSNYRLLITRDSLNTRFMVG